MNADCSMMQNAPACWSKLIGEGKIPKSMAGSALSRTACAAHYEAMKATPDDPSVVTYDVDMTIDPTGKTQVRSLGAIACEAMP
ncbi:MAG TPA: hypothetical protein VHS58_22975 [Acetobacteraceae bacterium]|nr:hypothetical protein [Acetobacteraceae bacterium]